MKMVHIIGMGVSPEDLTKRHLVLINTADILVGDKRHLGYFRGLDVTKRVINQHIDEAIDFIRANMDTQRIVVLMPGDPLFFGIGSLIVKRIGANRVELHPNISSVAAAFARIKEPWNNACVISLHGRAKEFELLAAIRTHHYIAVLTDPRKNPSWLALFLYRCGVQAIQMGVFSRLGLRDEHFQWYSLAEAVRSKFVEPNVVILKTEYGQRQAAVTKLHLGMPARYFGDPDDLATFEEVRAVALSKLMLFPGQTLWDLGSAGGALGIEASLFLGHGRICAVGSDIARLKRIRTNARRFSVYNLEPYRCDLPAGLGGLPKPDRIYIGENGRELESILEGTLAFITVSGVVVIAVSLLANLHVAINVLRRHRLVVDTTQVQVARSKIMPFNERFEAQNPVWVIRGERAR